MIIQRLSDDDLLSHLKLVMPQHDDVFFSGMAEALEHDEHGSTRKLCEAMLQCAVVTVQAAVQDIDMLMTGMTLVGEQENTPLDDMFDIDDLHRRSLRFYNFARAAYGDINLFDWRDRVEKFYEVMQPYAQQ